MIWIPTALPASGPLHRRLFEALAQDVASGLLAPGTRLPTHRELAQRLGVSVGTATRAYAEAERRGLITARVGRGSFVAGSPETSAGGNQRIDLSRNLPPLLPAQRCLANGLAELSPAEIDLLDYAPLAGAEAHRRSVARWVARTAGLDRVDAQRLILCNGAQHAMSLAFLALARPGATIFCEAVTFPGVKRIAALAGSRLHGIALDDEGIVPDALDREAADATAPAILYVTPTLQNPTARTMSAGRRKAIAEIAARHDLLIVEDDVYAPYLETPKEPPLAALAPERTFYLGSASKTLAPGLRAGWLLPPSAGPWRERTLAVLQATTLAASAFGHAILAQWIDDGTADRIAEAVRIEVRRRAAAATAILGGRIDMPRHPVSPHLWLPLSPLDAERGLARAVESGILLTPPAALAVDDRLASGLRLCLGGAPDLETLTDALQRLALALDRPASELEREAL